MSIAMLMRQSWASKGDMGMIRLALMAAALASVAQPASAQRGEPPRATFERGMRSSAGGAVLVALERNFPQDARRLIDRLYADAAANRGNLDAVLPRAAQAMIDVLRSRAAELANGPAPALVRIVRLKRDLVEQMRQQDIALCGRFSVQDPGQGIVMPPALRDRARQISIAMIDAAGAGSRAPRVAGRGSLSEPDRQAYVAALQRGDPGGELVVLIGDPVALRAASPERQCGVGLLLYQAVLDLPEERAGNVAAALLILELGVSPGGSTAR